jgi:predicted porin
METRNTEANSGTVIRSGLSALAIIGAFPAFGANAEIEALKQEVAAQRKIIERLLSGQEARPGNASEAAGSAAPKTNVTFYGVADVNVSSMDTGAGRKTSFNGGGGWSASRLGVKVDQPFDNGLSAVAVAEAGVQFDTGSTGAAAVTPGIDTTASSGGAPGNGSQIFARQIYAGLAGDFGKATIGRQYAGSYFAVAVVGSAQGEGLYGNAASYTPIIGGMPTRVNNALVYASPKIAGLSGVATYTTGSENNVNTSVPVGATTTNDKAGRGWDLALFYSLGRFNAAATTWQLKNNAWATAGETGLATKKGYQFAANYDFGAVKVFGDYVRGKISGGNYENVTKTLSDSTGWGLSALVPLGRHAFIAKYTVLNDKSLLNQDARIYSLAYGYELYKNTTLYANWGKVLNSDNAAYNLLNAGDLVGRVRTPGETVTGIMAGVNVKF